MSNLHNLNTTPIHPHFIDAGKKGHRKPGKEKRPLGDPVSLPKPYPRFIPPPLTNLQNLSLNLDLILSESEYNSIIKTGSLVFHSVGDTGGINGDEVEKSIADAMNYQIESNYAHSSPSFLYHLGDVIYYNGQSYLYNSQFYEPFQNYRAPIFAIPGNHDGDTHTRPNDPVDTEPSLFGFMRNFCDTSSNHESPYRSTMTQPYVYWTLDTPFATVIGLYSNVDGTLDARGTSEQQQWFEQQVQKSSVDKALIVSVHHPPYSLDTQHGGYPDIGISIDRVIKSTGRIPTLVLSGHVHSYQRFERTLGSKKVPYVIAGAGGYANSLRALHKIELDKDGNQLPSGFQTIYDGLKLEAFNDKEPGFLRVTVDKNNKTLTCNYFLVPFNDPTIKHEPFDTVTVPW
jgi:hypothetical protein